MPLRAARYPFALLAVLLVPSDGFAQDTADLPMAAASSGRPRECGADGVRPDRDWHINVWDAVRQPQLRRYCDLLGRAHARLASAPNVAREAAGLADQVLPGRAAPWVIRGRANVLMGDFAQAVRDFDHARSVDPRSVEDPPSLLDMATALRKVGRPADALAAYRVLITRLGLLPSPEVRVRIILEAASLASAAGPSGLPEAIAILREGVRQPLTRYDSDVCAMLLLALDRSDSPAESASLVEHLALSNAPSALAARDPSAFAYLSDPNDAAAMTAIALEPSDPLAALSAWERFIKASPSSPFLANAKRHVEKLRASPRPPGRPAPARHP